jgi:replication factor A1
MFKMALSEIIEKIKEKANVTEDEINLKIDEKLKQLSGLISKEGAAHIIANEYGVKVLDQVSGKLEIKNILAGMRDVETVGKIQQVFPVSEFQRKDGTLGKVASISIGDETGTIRVVMWGSQADAATTLKQDDIVKVLSGYVRENSGRKEIHLNDRSRLVVNPPGETVGEIKKEVPKRKSIDQLTEQDIDIELFATIVQVFDIRFFEVCPTCNKRARLRETSYICEEHGEVKPNYSYVLNLVLDDGKGTIRAVFFRDQLEHLLEKSKEEVITYKDAPEKIDELKTSLLGNQIKVLGRVNKNEMFDRLEFITRQVFPKPNPEEEIKLLQEQNAV